MTSKRDNHSNLSLFLRLLYMSATYTQIAARVVRFARLRRAKPRSARPASLFFSVGPHCVSWNQENVTQGPLAYHQWYTRYENLPGQSNNQKKKENPNLIQSSGTLSLMTLDQLLNEIEMRELEFKEKPNPALFKTLSAFANTNGGVVCIGVSNKKEITGYRSSNADLKELSDTIGNKLAIHPVIEPVKSDGKTVLRIDVKKSKAPVAYEGRYYTRVGNTTRLMDIEELKEFLISGIEWDSLTSQHGLADIDEETVRLFVRLAKSAGRLTAADEHEPVAAILTRLGLMTGDQLTNGAFLLFGKKQDKYLSDAVLRIGRFKDGSTIIGDHWIDGNLFHQLGEGEEALRNVLVHRDYFRKNEQIMIKVYDDVIWFHNPGGLPKGLSIEQLKAQPQSIPRNPLIARIFYLAGYIERYGSSIQRILTSFAEAELPEPEFRTDA